MIRARYASLDTDRYEGHGYTYTDGHLTHIYSFHVLGRYTMCNRDTVKASGLNVWVSGEPDSNEPEVE